jgi:phosphate transport system permease protein
VRSWPKVASFSLGLIPVFALAAMVATVVNESRPAFTEIGVRELSDTKFSSLFLSGKAHYGLLPAFWGSIELLVVAMMLALPVSIAMAVFASEFAPGRLGGAMRALLGVMSGIPPIIYALMAIVFVAPFMIPKFTSNLEFSNVHPEKIGFTAAQWPPPDVPWSAGAFPWDPSGGNNSVLLAGILLAMLAVPFMAPLIEDALRNVPQEPKQASLALGASRWYTLMHITLPHALSGIISASRLGALKVLGDLMIALFVVGYAAPHFPDPPWDVLERTAPLTAAGAGLVGGLGSPKSCQAVECSVGYVTGLLLLVIAVVVVALTTILERRFRRRFA